MEVKELTSGARSILQREAWVTGLFAQVKYLIASYGNAEVSTCSSLSVTSLKNSYVRGRVYPFINIPIRLREKELLGLYEYCDQLPFSDQHIYCDFVIHSIYYADKKDSAFIRDLEERARQYLQTKGYEVVQFEDGMAAITIDRRIVEEEEEFGKLLNSLLDEAIKMQVDIE